MSYSSELAEKNACMAKDLSLEIARKSIELGCSIGKTESKIENARMQGDIFPNKIVAGKCPIEAGGNCPLRPQDKWIPVSEKLPEYSGLYLISVDDLITVANFTGTYFMRRGGFVEVDAWMPLIEPYKPYQKGGAE